MIESLVIFSLAATGSFVCLSADLAHKFLARKTHAGTVPASPGRSPVAASLPSMDPVMTCGLVLACYGAVALILVSALPGAFALERTGLAFGLLCAGGLIGEIATTGASRELPAAEGDDEGSHAYKPMSVPLSVALMLVLNLALAVLTSGQGLLEIVPPKSVSATHSQELEPIVVVSERKVERRSHAEPF